jgi:uncharacterized membrane protein YdfJ with MMPL/SSD domain
VSGLARAVLRRRRLVVGLWVVAILAAMPLAGRLSDELSGGGYEVPGSDSERARTVLERKVLGSDEAQELFVVVPAELDGRAVGPIALRGRAADAAAALRGESRVRAVGAPRISPNGRTALLPFVIVGSFDEVMRAVDDLRDQVGRVEGAEITGQAAVFDANAEIASEDLAKAESISLPITLAILVVAFLSVVAALLPIGLALVALSITFAALLGVTQVVETSVFVTNSALLIGLGLSIDYSLFVVSRYREEHARSGSVEGAVEVAMRTAGRAVLFSGLTVAISLASLLVVGVELFTSMAIGATLAALVAALTALTLLPALLAMLGPRVDRLSLRRAVRAAGRGTLWQRLAALVLRRRVASAVVSGVLLLALAAPLLDLNIGFPSTATRLPADDNPIAAATKRVERDFGGGALFPFEVLTRANPSRVAAIPEADPGIERVLPPVRGRDGWTRIVAVGGSGDNTPASRATLDRLRATLDVRFPGTLVGGQTAEGEDLADRIGDRFPLVVLAAAMLTFVLLFAAFRSLVVPLKAVVTNLLTVGATLGMLTLIFQWVGTSDSIAFFVPLFLFAVLFGLSMDYEVFLISRIRDEYLAGASNDDSVARGLIRSGRPITLAAIVMITVFAASAVSSLEPFQQFGVGMSLAVLIDATLARCLLVPAAMALLGSRNWWAPRFLSGTRPPQRAVSEGAQPR